MVRTEIAHLTKNLPKLMIPILGKSVMEYLIELRSNCGITDIMMNVAHNHHKIEPYFGDGRRLDVQIGYAYAGVREQGEIIPIPLTF